MDGSTIFYIVLGIATLIFQIYKEKKKKEELRQSGEHGHAQPPAEDFFDFFNRPEARERVRQEYQEDFSSETSADENILDKPGPAPVFLENPLSAMVEEARAKSVEYTPVPDKAIIDDLNYGEGIRTTDKSVQIETIEKDHNPEITPFSVDPKLLVIYSELMTPKFRE